MKRGREVPAVERPVQSEVERVPGDVAATSFHLQLALGVLQLVHEVQAGYPAPENPLGLEVGRIEGRETVAAVDEIWTDRIDDVVL